MADLFEDAATSRNAPEFSVSDIANAVKRVIEGEFAHVRVRGEIGRISRPGSGHVYLDLKDEKSVLASVIWKGQLAGLQMRPEEGMEVIATGRLTTFGMQSKYQLVIEDMAPAGVGALMVMLEKRRKALEAEGLFAAERKQALPFLPSVIGVVTSPSGAVIRDILHRLRDRFPCTVLIWPVVVQGEKCAPEVANAIRGFNAIAAGGAIPRPDVLIVARGGGSVEDLWGFNEEIVVRAAAASTIPLISAVGHETDTTLIDFAADRRAPTPTAAAEMAVPVRLELLARSASLGARQSQAAARRVEALRQRLRDLGRALPRPEAMLAERMQRLDNAGQRLGNALLLLVQKRRTRLGQVALGPQVLRADLRQKRQRLEIRAGRMGSDLQRLLAALSQGLSPVAARMDKSVVRKLEERRATLTGLERTLATLGVAQTLRRGFAIIRAGDAVVTSRQTALAHGTLDIEFQDGHLRVDKAGHQSDLFSHDPAGRGKD